MRMMASFDISRVLILYIVWHYTRALYDLFAIWSDGLRFILHFFSISLLLRTFFSPWRRLHEENRGGLLNISDFIAAKTVNLIMRCVGMVMRLLVISAGLIAFAVFFGMGIFMFFCWLFLPLGVAALSVVGVSYLLGIR
jgi:hypothetical protein